LGSGTPWTLTVPFFRSPPNIPSFRPCALTTDLLKVGRPNRFLPGKALRFLSILQEAPFNSRFFWGDPFGRVLFFWPTPGRFFLVWSCNPPIGFEHRFLLFQLVFSVFFIFPLRTEIPKLRQPLPPFVFPAYPPFGRRLLVEDPDFPVLVVLPFIVPFYRCFFFPPIESIPKCLRSARTPKMPLTRSTSPSVLLS